MGGLQLCSGFCCRNLLYFSVSHWMGECNYSVELEYMCKVGMGVVGSADDRTAHNSTHLQDSPC